MTLDEPLHLEPTGRSGSKTSATNAYESQPAWRFRHRWSGSTGTPARTLDVKNGAFRL
jgi:hypothetical protein